MFYRIKQALYRFMYGRYGTDNLNRAMLVLYIVIIAARFITMIFSDSVAAALVFAVRCVKRSKCTGDCANCAKRCKKKEN